MSAAKVLDSLETETISPEEKLRRLEASNPGFKVYRMYDEGRLITNPDVVRGIYEGQEFIKFLESWEKKHKYEHEDDDFDEEN